MGIFNRKNRKQIVNKHNHAYEATQREVTQEDVERIAKKQAGTAYVLGMFR